MKPVSFFDDAIAIKPGSSSDPALIGRRVTLGEFSQGGKCALYEMENGDLLARLDDGRFIQGQEFHPRLAK
jgi:hypothetical protein